MNVAVITERIGAAVAAGQLRRMADPADFIQVSTVRDLLRPWTEVFPGADPEAEGEDRSVFGHKGLRKPRFRPSPRRSRRPLPAPHRLAPPLKLLSPFLFAAVRGIEDFYQSRGIAAAELLAEPFTPEGLDAFCSPLSKELSSRYPLGIWLEECFWQESLAELRGVALLLPHWTYEDDSCGVVEAFLSGADGLHWLLRHYYDSDTDRADLRVDDLELPEEDKQLIADVGFGTLTRTYADFDGKKTCDLQALEDWQDTFFAEVYERFGHESSYDVITDDPGQNCEIVITCAADIEFAIAYHDAFDKMMNAMPNLYEFDNNQGGALETFIHELCNVWRKTNRKRLVKWQSPKLATLAHLYRQGEL